ncbi:uncharacterized protein LOC116619312 [Nematostella vectensis]|uniref:uncharacterized protein LOC116619312 n=1 Tax=Nematostella vectensis TaxID=45351 RepID=UPI002076F138|nr:uncharacterized protein LOC116619312 [Nematostella vectensis]
MPFDEEEEEEPKSYLELLGTNDHPLEEPAASPDPIALYSGFSELDKLREENRLLKAEVESLRSQLTSSRRQPVPSAEVINFFRDFVSFNDVTNIQYSAVGGAPCQEYTIRANLNPGPTTSQNQRSRDDVKLLDSSDVYVNRNALRSCVQAGHSAKSPIGLLKKLIPIVFSAEELARSCGQGLARGGASQKEDEKAPLDQHKVNACKDYLVAFCLQNKMAQPGAQGINKAFTQQITYARTKLKIQSAAVNTE